MTAKPKAELPVIHLTEQALREARVATAADALVAAMEGLRPFNGYAVVIQGRGMRVEIKATQEPA